MSCVSDACSTCDCKTFTSQTESAIINSSEPISVIESEQINVNGEIGIWVNKAESENFVGPLPVNQYPINKDPVPQVIHKKPKCVECHRDVTVKYLEPPAIPSPGPIVINQAQNILAPPAPPVIIRQVPCNPIEPETLVVREVPPQPPHPPNEKLITIPGELLPPPPRKVVIERLPELPDKPQDVHIERWLPFKDIKRQIILNPKPADPVQCKPRNLIVNWEKRNCCHVNTDIINLGVEKTDPEAYLQIHGATLSHESQMPEICDEVKKEHGIPLAVDQCSNSFYKELEGDIHALKMIDLDAEGLSDFKKYLNSCNYCNHCPKCNQPDEKSTPKPSTEEVEQVKASVEVETQVIEATASPVEDAPVVASPAPAEETLVAASPATPAPAEETLVAASPATATPAPAEETLVDASPAPATPAPAEETLVAASPAPASQTPVTSDLATPALAKETLVAATPAPASQTPIEESPVEESQVAESPAPIFSVPTSPAPASPAPVEVPIPDESSAPASPAPSSPISGSSFQMPSADEITSAVSPAPVFEETQVQAEESQTIAETIVAETVVEETPAALEQTLDESDFSFASTNITEFTIQSCAVVGNHNFSTPAPLLEESTPEPTSAQDAPSIVYAVSPAAVDQQPIFSESPILSQAETPQAQVLSPVQEEQTPAPEASIAEEIVSSQSQVEELSNYSLVNIETPVASFEKSIVVESSQLELTIATEADYVPIAAIQSPILEKNESIYDETITEEPTVIEVVTSAFEESVQQEEASVNVETDSATSVSPMTVIEESLNVE